MGVVGRWLLQGWVCALHSLVVVVVAAAVAELGGCSCRFGRIAPVGQCARCLQH